MCATSHQGGFSSSQQAHQTILQLLALKSNVAAANPRPRLQEALLALPGQLQQQLLPESDVIDITLQIYAGLADTTAALPWLKELLSKQPVLLVKHRGQLRFKSASCGQPIYLEDDLQLSQLFAGDCCVLAVPPEQLPLLGKLLLQVKPRLQCLSQAVKRSYAAAGSSSSSGGVMSERWTSLLRAVLPLIARCVEIPVLLPVAAVVWRLGVRAAVNCFHWCYKQRDHIPQICCIRKHASRVVRCYVNLLVNAWCQHAW